MRSNRNGFSFEFCVLRFAAVGMLAFAYSIAASTTALAQVTSATILGTVTDPSGAAVANASVTATNVSTGRTYSATTGSSGEYLIPLLPIGGSYEVGVQAPGFQRFLQNGITLLVNQNARVDASLKIGASSETVQVSGTPPLVDTHGSSLG